MKERVIFFFLVMAVLLACASPAAANGNTAPVADANGPYYTAPGVPVTFDGSGSYDPDADDSIISWQWDLDNDGLYDDESGVSPTHTYYSVGVYTIGLRVTDTFGATDTDTTTVSIENKAPVADANGPYYTVPGVPVTLDGSGSYDPDEPYDSIVSWQWDLDNDGLYDEAVGELVTLSGSLPLINVEGVYTVGLRVTDAFGATDTDTTTLTVSSQDIPEFPTITIPMIAVLGLAFLFQRRKG
jgi:PKD repeat protein